MTSLTLPDFLQRYANHKLVSSVQEQVSAFRQGLGVFVDDELCKNLRSCCTTLDLQQLLCGAETIDIDEWRSLTRYEPATYSASQQVKWLWAVSHYG